MEIINWNSRVFHRPFLCYVRDEVANMFPMSNLADRFHGRGWTASLIRAVFTALFLTAFSPGAARADSLLAAAPYALQEALATDQHVDLYAPQSENGFKIGSSYFAGLADGVMAPGNLTNFDDSQRLYALLIDGRYDFDYDTPALSSSLHPYLMGSMGVATAMGYGYAGDNLSSSNGSAVPLLRLGGGVAYHLDQHWNMSLDYKAGLAAASPADYLFTGRNQQQQVDLQTLNVGMHYAF